MQIKTEKRMVEQLINTYIAEDGKEFNTRADCENYEDKLQEQKIKAEAEKLELKELDLYPLDIDAQYISSEHSFAWYKVNNAEEYETILKAYNMDDYGYIKSYPEVVCVEYEGYWGRDAWIHLLSEMKTATEYFWKRHGFDVEFKEVTKWKEIRKC